MTRRFILRPRAENDIQAAFEWYESKAPGLGGEFLGAVRERLESIRAFPEASPIIYRDIRRAVVSRFPYVIFYVIRPAVLAIASCAQAGDVAASIVRGVEADASDLP
jgi:plasmid stabilization system protein ParE